MNQTQNIIPDIELELPSEWSWYRRDQPILVLGHDSEGGVLHISTPAPMRSWRYCDHLDPLIRGFVERTNLDQADILGDLLQVEVGEMPYGRFVRAECMSERYGDVCVWAVVPETHDPLCVTWLADAPTEIGRTARHLVTSIRCGLFSAALANAVGTLQTHLATGNPISTLTFLFCDATREVTALDLSPLNERLHVQEIRRQRARLNASIVIRQVNVRDPSPQSSSRRRGIRICGIKFTLQAVLSASVGQGPRGPRS
jgi:hypothetical protein